MPLPISLILKDLEVIPKRSSQKPLVTLIINISSTCLNVEEKLQSLFDHDANNIEIIIVDFSFFTHQKNKITHFQEQDDRVTLLRLRRNRGIPAIANNIALQHASGKYIAYQIDECCYRPASLEAMLNTAEQKQLSLVIEHDDSISTNKLNYVLHTRELLEKTGLIDVHILLANCWESDFYDQLISVSPPPSTSISFVQESPNKTNENYENLVSLAKLRPRFQPLDSRNFNEIDVLDSSFITSSIEYYQYCNEIVAPYIASHWQLNGLIDSQLIPYLVTRHPLKLLLRGGIGTASVEITYGNFARVFPDCLTLHTLIDDAQIDFDFHALINFRYQDRLSTTIHESLKDTGKAIFYAMDDNLLRLSELFIQIHSNNSESLKIKTQNVIEHIHDADLVLTWSDFCAKDVSPHNPRVSILKTNIEKKYLPQHITKAAIHRRLHFSTLSANLIHKLNWWQLVVTEWVDFFHHYRDQVKLILFYNRQIDIDTFQEWFKDIDYEIRPRQDYFNYLTTVTSRGFDVVISQSLEDIEFTKSKCPIKFLEATACGAILITSDTQAYKSIKPDIECLKVPNEKGAWYEALEYSLQLGQERRSLIWQAARERIEQDFTTESQYFSFFTAHQFGLLHSKLNSKEIADGKPKVIVTLNSYNTKEMINIGSLLNQYCFDIIYCEKLSLDEESISYIQKFNQNELAFIITSMNEVIWIDAANKLNIPLITLAGIKDIFLIDSNNLNTYGVIIAYELYVALELRRLGCVNVYRLWLSSFWNESYKCENTYTKDDDLCIGIFSGNDFDLYKIEFALIKSNLNNYFRLKSENDDSKKYNILIIGGNNQNVINAVIKAMSSGIIVIAIESTDSKDIISNGVNGFYIDHYSEYYLISLLNQVIDMAPNQQKFIINNAWSTIKYKTKREIVALDFTSIIKTHLKN